MKSNTGADSSSEIRRREAGQYGREFPCKNAAGVRNVKKRQAPVQMH